MKIPLASAARWCDKSFVRPAQCLRRYNKTLDAQDHPALGWVNTCLKRCDASCRTLGNLPRAANPARGFFFCRLNSVATVDTATGIDGQCCPLNDWRGRSRKTTRRLGRWSLSGCGGTVALTGAPAQAGVAIRREAATTVRNEFVGLWVYRMTATRQQRQADTGRCPVFGNHTDPSVVRLCARSEHHSLRDGGVVSVFQPCVLDTGFGQK